MAYYPPVATYYDSNDNNEDDYAIGRAVTESVNDKAFRKEKLAVSSNLNFARLSDRDAVYLANSNALSSLLLKQAVASSCNSNNSVEKDNTSCQNEEQFYCPLPLSYCENEYARGYEVINTTSGPCASLALPERTKPLSAAFHQKFEKKKVFKGQPSTVLSSTSDIDIHLDEDSKLVMDDAFMQEDLSHLFNEPFLSQSKPDMFYGSTITSSSTPVDSYLHSYSVDQLSRLSEISSPPTKEKFDPSDRKSHYFNSCANGKRGLGTIDLPDKKRGETFAQLNEDNNIERKRMFLTKPQEILLTELGAIDLPDEIFSHLYDDKTTRRKSPLPAEPHENLFAVSVGHHQQHASYQKEKLVTSTRKPCFVPPVIPVGKPMPPPPRLPSLQRHNKDVNR